MATVATDKVMLALESASQFASMEQEGWVTLSQIKAAAYSDSIVSPVTVTAKRLDDLVAMSRAQTMTHKQWGRMWRPFRGGAGFGGDAAPRVPDYVPRGGPPTSGGPRPEDYGDVTTVGGGGGVGVPAPIGGIIRSVMT